MEQLFELFLRTIIQSTHMQQSQHSAFPKAEDIAERRPVDTKQVRALSSL